MKASRTFIFLIFWSLLLASCTTYQQPSTVRDGSRPIGPEINTGSSTTASIVAATISPYQQQLQAQMRQVIGQVPETMKKGSPESSLGNWLADLLQAAAPAIFPEVDIAFSVQNAGGIRVPELVAGPLEKGEIYELMPFDNILVVVEANGFVVDEFIQHMASEGGWPVSKELRYTIQDGKATNISIGGEALQLNRNYYVAMPDYVANGGSDAKMLADRKQTSSGRFLRDIIIEHTSQSAEPVRGILDGRVKRLQE